MSGEVFRAACVQPSSGQDMAANLATVGEMVASLKKQWGEFQEPVRL